MEAQRVELMNLEDYEGVYHRLHTFDEPYVLIEAQVLLNIFDNEHFE